jgi:hypothetical protein
VDPSLGHVEKMIWMGEILLGMGFVTYKGSQCLIYGCLCRGCVAPSFSMHHFSKPIKEDMQWYVRECMICQDNRLEPTHPTNFL